MVKVTCPYCGDTATLSGGDVIYPHRPDLHHKKFYRCELCDAYVGCHPGTITPLGRLANAELRKAKTQAHAAFDPLWKTGYMSRSAAYAWLAKCLKLPPEQCHIGMFDVATCEIVVGLSRKRFG